MEVKKSGPDFSILAFIFSLVRVSLAAAVQLGCLSGLTAVVLVSFNSGVLVQHKYCTVRLLGGWVFVPLCFRYHHQRSIAREPGRAIT
ncbi:hypothetical protein HOY80DRAFT_105331 [Tuber brumale]|nr:hypothetical protein HOY80DRAFT_105331 [Tuber brumale]